MGQLYDSFYIHTFHISQETRPGKSIISNAVMVVGFVANHIPVELESSTQVRGLLGRL